MVNPTSVFVDADVVRHMSDTIRQCDPQRVTISDTVYASFVGTFTTLGQHLPENTLGCSVRWAGRGGIRGR